MKTAFFGIGGIGGFIGGMVARREAETYFFARGANLRAIRESGLFIESVQIENFLVQPKCITDDAAEIGVVDVLFITVKGYDLNEACSTAAPMIGPNTVVIPLLNGLIVSEQMEPLLPPCIIADGCIRAYCHLEKPGHVFHQSGGQIIIGMRNGEHVPVLYDIADMLSTSGVPTVVSEDIRLESWKKYVYICGNSAVFCWFDAPAGAVRQMPGYETEFRAIMEELVSVAEVKGIELPKDTIENALDAFFKMDADTVTSLYRDLCSGKPPEKTELFHLIGKMVQLGAETGVPTPYCQAVLRKFS